MTDREPIPMGRVRVRHPGGATMCSWGALEYQVREDGSFAVPAPAVADLLAHGFVGDETPEPQQEPEAALPRLVIPA